MRILGIHSHNFAFSAKQEASSRAEDLGSVHQQENINEECLVIFTAIEQGDEAGVHSVARQLARDVRKRSEQLGVGRIVLYPYVHLTEKPGSVDVSMQVLQQAEQLLAEAGLNVMRAPFGWYKAFSINCLGHPLSEWSARYEPVEDDAIETNEQPERKGSEFVRFILADLDGNTYEVTPENFERCELFRNKSAPIQHLRQFVANEFGRSGEAKGVPKHIEYIKRHDLLDYCDASEKGHYKWYPKGLLIQRLMLDYAAQLAFDWGAFEMKNPILIRGDHNTVGQLMGEFHERDYKVDGGRGIGYLRYASDPLAFPFMQKVSFSHKQSPLKVYEEASCFRNEQQGEVSGLKRVRNFTMTDMHAACANTEEACEEFERLCHLFAGLMNHIIASGRWVLGWEGTVEFFDQHREWLVSIGKQLGVPALFKLMPEMSHYYAMKNEFQAITADGANVQISTVQWDVKDGERFDIGYVDEQGHKQPCPVILHASSFGSIERALCAILENIAIDAGRGVAPMFPFWLSPTQVRVIPVSDKHLAPARDVLQKLRARKIRADLDDRDETLGRKIRDGEKEWIPYLVVLGDQELESGLLAVRSRSPKKQHKLKLDELIAVVHDQARDMPFRQMMFPPVLSQRPLFQG
jgi:threonyl-tRNA synthetase